MISFKSHPQLTLPAFRWRLGAGLRHASLALGGLCLATAALALPTQPAQKPMLTASTGAKPNLMITLDNSGSMAYPYQEDYAVSSSDKAVWQTTKVCQLPLYGADGTINGAPDSSNRCKKISSSSNKTFSCTKYSSYKSKYTNGSVSNNGTTVVSNSQVTKYYTDSSCKTKYETTNINQAKYVTGTYTENSLTPANANTGYTTTNAWSKNESPWHAMRSAQVNPLYYNPQFTYPPRVNPNGTPVAVSDAWKFISNQTSVDFTYCMEEEGKRYFSFWDPADNTLSSCNSKDYSLTGEKIPQVVGYKTTNASTPAFTWVYCPNSSNSNCSVDKMQVVDVYPSTTSVPLPPNHQRTDCGLNATTCSGTQEIQNILNWYRYYSYRADAVATSIGIALAGDLYKEKMRIGYYGINNAGSSNTLQPGNDTTSLDKTRGVRLNSIANNQALYDWLYAYGSLPRGGTPLHNSVRKMGEYYQAETSETKCTKTDRRGNCTTWSTTTAENSENPWAMDPSQKASANNKELTCRRSFNILFSDGAWSGVGSAWTDLDSTKKWAATNGSTFPGSTALSNFEGYRPAGYANDPAKQKLFTPFVNTSTAPAGGLSDMTALYAWHKDLRPALANEITTKPGKPVNWQNMTTYTVGYLIEPSEGANGLSFSQIDDYKLDYLKNGNAATKPNWATSVGTIADKNDNNNTPGRIDDFIQAGYTGGGAGYSVTTADDVRHTFDLILSDILNAAGKDAGVAVAGTSSTTSTLEGRLKYSVGYKTVDNSGNLEAIRLSASGNNAGTVWDSNKQWLPAKDRKLFVYDKVTNQRKTIGYSTTLGSLPGALHKAIDPNGALPTGTEFIRYLLGEDSALANSRTRTPGLASSVNAPPLYVGSRLNMGYGRDNSTVPGKANYVTYFSNKISIPGTIYAAANDGQVHVFNAADTDANEEVKDSTNKTIPPGTEVASFLLRTTMPKLQSYASPAYNFEYMADGPLVEQDVWDGSAWKQMVFGTTGRGGKGVFAFNSPLNTGANKNRIPTEEDYKWEATDSDLANIGYVSNPVAAGFTEDGKSVLLVSGGHYANTGKAGLYVLDALTGDEIAFIELPNGYDFGVGLGGVTVVRNAARQIVAAYAGDANGNLWRFNLRGNSTAWGVSNNQPLFTTPGNQPIYAAPAWQVHPGANGDACQSSASPGACGTIVVIGTGILLDDTHLSNTDTQSIYGIWDNTPIGGNDEAYKSKDSSYSLVTQTIDQVNSKAGVGSSLGNTFYQVSKNDVDWKKNYGWRLDLGKLTNTAGERVIGDPFNLGSSVFVTSVVISDTQTTEDSCIAASGAVNVMYGIDALTGGGKRSFDQDGDGKLDPFSVVYLPKGGFTRSSVLTQNSNVSDILDPNLKIGVGDPKEGDIDLLPKSKADGSKGYSTGIDGSILLGDGTESSGWRRSWRQIINLPSTL